VSFIYLRESVRRGRESKPTVLQLILTGRDRERERERSTHLQRYIVPYHKNAFLENFDIGK